jgi:hypothetical protein
VLRSRGIKEHKCREIARGLLKIWLLVDFSKGYYYERNSLTNWRSFKALEIVNENDSERFFIYIFLLINQYIVALWPKGQINHLL